MRTYFILAALMGIFAFGSISLLAHAQDGDDAASIAAPAENEMPAPTDEAPVEEVPSGPSAEDVKRDTAQCKKEAYARRNRGGVQDKRTQEERDQQYLDCMSALGYTTEEIDGSRQ